MSSTRGRRARRRSSPTTGSSCSRRCSSCSRRCSRRLSEAITGERLTVGPPFFNKWMTPIGLALLLLTGIAPLLAWRKSTISNLRFQFMWPVLASVVTAVALVRARRARVRVGALLRAVRVRHRDDRPGVRARRARAAGGHGHRRLHRARRRRRAVEAAIRRLHRAPRDRAHLPRHSPARASSWRSRCS